MPSDDSAPPSPRCFHQPQPAAKRFGQGWQTPQHVHLGLQVSKATGHSCKLLFFSKRRKKIVIKNGFGAAVGLRSQGQTRSGCPLQRGHPFPPSPFHPRKANSLLPVSHSVTGVYFLEHRDPPARRGGFRSTARPRPCPPSPRGCGRSAEAAPSVPQDAASRALRALQLFLKKLPKGFCTWGPLAFRVIYFGAARGGRQGGVERGQAPCSGSRGR